MNTEIAVYHTHWLHATCCIQRQSQMTASHSDRLRKYLFYSTVSVISVLL